MITESTVVWLYKKIKSSADLVNFNYKNRISDNASSIDQCPNHFVFLAACCLQVLSFLSFLKGRIKQDITAAASNSGLFIIN